MFTVYPNFSAGAKTISSIQRTRPVPTGKKNSIFNDPSFIPDQKVYSPIPFHYSNVALVLERSPEQEARDEFARSQEASSSASSSTSSALPEVVASRVRATNVRYDWRARRWTWKRVAENVAEIDPVTGHKQSVEWPRRERVAKFKAGKPYLRELLHLLTSR